MCEDRCVCVCVPFDWLENRLHFNTSSFDKTENVCSICTRMCTRVSAETNI